MQLFWRLVLAHLLADFTLQTDYIARWKRRNALGALVHSLIFLACALALTFPFLGSTWLPVGRSVAVPGWLALILLTFFHFCEDEWRVWTVERIPNADTFLFFLWDQFIHLLFIFVFFRPGIDGGAEPWVMGGILFVLVTHFTLIVVYYTEKDRFGSSASLENGKYSAMAERTVTAALLLVPGGTAFVAAAVWITLTIVRARRISSPRSWRAIIVGNVLAVLFGITGRTFFYA